MPPLAQFCILGRILFFETGCSKQNQESHTMSLANYCLPKIAKFKLHAAAGLCLSEDKDLGLTTTYGS
jgi:hypothetical protein